MSCSQTVNENEISTEDTNHLYLCMNDESGQTAQFFHEFETCVSDDADSCDAQSMSALQECMLEMDDVEVPENNTECMQEGLTTKNMKAMKNKFPALFGETPKAGANKASSKSGANNKPAPTKAPSSNTNDNKPSFIYYH